MKILDPQTQARQHRLQMDIMLKDADYKKNERKKADLDIAIRDLKKKKQQIEMEMFQKENELKKLVVTQVQLFNDIKKLKSALNNL